MIVPGQRMTALNLSYICEHISGDGAIRHLGYEVAQ